MENLTQIEKIVILQNLLISCATGGDASDEEYTAIRLELLADQSIKSLLPRFVTTSRSLSQFWTFIKFKYPTYQERRQYLWQEFNPLLERLENKSTSPVYSAASTVLEQFDAEHVWQVWQRALDRQTEDTDGAITSARTLLESVCKHILDDMNVVYAEGLDLPKLYKATSEQLNLAPSQHTEQVFKQILGGCQSVVEGLGSVRNKLGDAHGRGKQPIKAAPRHAELAVNLAGAMATFLVRTWQYRKENSAT